MENLIFHEKFLGIEDGKKWIDCTKIHSVSIDQWKDEWLISIFFGNTEFNLKSVVTETAAKEFSIKFMLKISSFGALNSIENISCRQQSGGFTAKLQPSSQKNN